MEIETLVFASVWSLIAIVLFSVIPFVFMEKQRERRTEDEASLRRNTSPPDDYENGQANSEMKKEPDEFRESKCAMPPPPPLSPPSPPPMIYKNTPPSPKTHELHAQLQQLDIKKELIELRERERMRNAEAEVRKTDEAPCSAFNAAGDRYTDPDGVTWSMTKGGRFLQVEPHTRREETLKWAVNCEPWPFTPGVLYWR